MDSTPNVGWKRPYWWLAALHHALVVVAGVIVVLLQRSFWSQRAAPIGSDSLLLPAVLLYAVLDLIRIPFASGSVVSLGFPVLLTALLRGTSPAYPVVVAAGGSVLSELAYSFLRRAEQGWMPALRQAAVRAVLYAGHHAVAGFAASVAFLLLNPSLAPAMEHLRAVAAYALVYGAVSTLVLWPHDWWVGHLLSEEEERLPRVEIIATAVVMAPIPVVFNYLYDLTEGPARGVVYVLPFLFLGLLLLARSFARTEIERGRLRARERARERIGSPPNLSELTHNVFEATRSQVRYRWGALYSVEGEEQDAGEDEGKTFRLRGEQGADGSVEAYGLQVAEDRRSAGESLELQWPDEIGPGDAYLGALARQGASLVSFERAPVVMEAYRLPANTALVALPLWAEGEVVGLLALARPRKLFTLAERGRVQVLTEVLGGTLHRIQYLESQLRDLYEEIGQVKDPGAVQQALDDLIRLNVDVPRLLAAMSEWVFRTNLRVTLRELVVGRFRDAGLALSPAVLGEIYRQVREEVEGMPPWSPEIGEMLQTVNSALSLAFSFRYKWPAVSRGSEYEDLYKDLAKILDASTVPDIIARETVIEQMIGDLRGSSLSDRNEISGRLWDFREVIGLLREAEESTDATRITCLSEALRSLHEVEQSAQAKLEDPERFTMVQVASAWQTVVTNALRAAREGSAELAMALGSTRVLALEEVTVQLKLGNKGPGLASGVVVEMLPSEDYRTGDGGRVELGPLPAGYSRELEFQIGPRSGLEMIRVAFQIIYRDRGRQEKREEFADRIYVGEAPSPFVEIDNPYVAGRPLPRGHPLFFGREDVFRFIRRTVGGSARGEQVLLLVGERRTGKTSILKQLPERLEDERYVHVFFDCQGLPGRGMTAFFLKLSSAIVRGLREAGLSLDGLSPADLRDQPQYVFEEQFLPQVWECVGDRSLLLAVDEFEALEMLVRAGRLDRVVFPYLRALMQSQERMAFIFVGTHRIEELVADYWSVLLNIAAYKRIGFLGREPAIRLITEPVSAFGVVYDELALNEILRVTAGHPYFLQLLCDCLMERCNDQRCNYVTVQAVRNARDEIIDLGRAHLSYVWEHSTPAGKATLAALADLLRDRSQAMAADIVGHLAQRLRNLTDRNPFDLSTVMGALERLGHRDIVREITNGKPAYVFTATLYREFISTYKSLDKIVPELIKEAISVEHTPGGEQIAARQEAG